MSRRALLVFLPFALAAMALVGVAIAGTQGGFTITPSHPSGWYTSPITLTWSVPAGAVFASGCEDRAINESDVTAYTCSAAPDETSQRVSETVIIGVDLTDPTFPDPPDIGPVLATGPAGVEVNYTPSATDNFGVPTVTCNPPSPHVFPVGTHTVNCTARDAAGRTTSADFTVAVVPPNTPPSLGLPGPVTAEATGPAGASVSYNATASDAEDGSLKPVCSPESGDTFALGPTTVNCTATDSGSPPLSTSGSFTVTVQDTTDPVVSVPGSMTVQPTGPSGVIVNFTATAFDLVAGALTPTCSPASGTQFTIEGSPHLVTCTASDGHNTGSNSFSISVQDADVPIVNVPASITVEANGPNGAVVNYAAVTATDMGSGTLQATCFPPSGATIPLGTWLVECSATDSSGHVGSASFSIRVRDTTPPVLTIPGALAIQSSGPVAATDSRIRTFLGGATATDIVDTNPAVTTNAPSSFPVGVTTVTFTARDDSGNTTQKNTTVTVSPDPVGPQPGGDSTPPQNVSNVRAILGNLAVALSWKPPANDFDHVDIVQSPGRSGNNETVVYSGKKSSYVAKGLAKGTEYRFVVIAFDKAGNRAAGVAVVALAQEQTLLAPPNGAVVSKAPLVKWKPVKGTRYYNAQIWYEGAGAGKAVLAATAVRKVMSVWPTKPSFKMKKSWRFAGKKFGLKPGRYLLYIWPGIGAKSAGRYGKMIVQAEFTYRRGG